MSAFSVIFLELEEATEILLLEARKLNEWSELILDIALRLDSSLDQFKSACYARVDALVENSHYLSLFSQILDEVSSVYKNAEKSVYSNIESGYLYNKTHLYPKADGDSQYPTSPGESFPYPQAPETGGGLFDETNPDGTQASEAPGSNDYTAKPSSNHENSGNAHEYPPLLNNMPPLSVEAWNWVNWLNDRYPDGYTHEEYFSILAYSVITSSNESDAWERFITIWEYFSVSQNAGDKWREIANDLISWRDSANNPGASQGGAWLGEIKEPSPGFVPGYTPEVTWDSIPGFAMGFTPEVMPDAVAALFGAEDINAFMSWLDSAPEIIITDKNPDGDSGHLSELPFGGTPGSGSLAQGAIGVSSVAQIVSSADIPSISSGKQPQSENGNQTKTSKAKKNKAPSTGGSKSSSSNNEIVGNSESHDGNSGVVDGSKNLNESGILDDFGKPDSATTTYVESLIAPWAAGAVMSRDEDGDSPKTTSTSINNGINTQTPSEVQSQNHPKPVNNFVPLAGAAAVTATGVVAATSASLSKSGGANIKTDSLQDRFDDKNMVSAAHKKAAFAGNLKGQYYIAGAIFNILFTGMALVSGIKTRKKINNSAYSIGDAVSAILKGGVVQEPRISE